MKLTTLEKARAKLELADKMLSTAKELHKQGGDLGTRTAIDITLGSNFGVKQADTLLLNQTVQFMDKFTPALWALTRARDAARTAFIAAGGSL